MEDPEVTSYYNDEEDLQLRKNFSLYISNIELELQRFGFQVTQSEILGYIMEKLTSNFLKRSEVVEEYNIPIDASEQEISRYIINRKYPYMYRFEAENTGLNRFQRFMRGTRINNVSDKTATRILRTSQIINLLFFISAGFVGLQSLFSLVLILSSSQELAESFLLLDGDFIYGYDLLWGSNIIYYIGGFFIFDVIQTYLVLNIPTLGRTKPKLNNNYSKAILRMKLNFVMAYSYISYLILGSIILIEEERVNGLEPVKDLGIPILFSFVCTIFGVYMWIQFQKERISSSNYQRPKMRFRSTFYVTDIVTLLLSIGLLGFLGLTIISDANKILEFANNSDSTRLDYNLAVLNLITLLSLSFYLILFVLSSVINQSHDKNQWNKFISMQILFQAVLVLFYILIEYYMITKLNEYMIIVDRNFQIGLNDLWQGARRYYVSVVFSLTILRFSK